VTLPDASPIRVLWNEGAGVKAGLPTNRTPSADDLREVFRGHGIDAWIIPTGSAEDAVRETRRAIADGCRTVVAAGGDGTVREIARTLIGSGVALGVLPLGSVMNVARSLDIPRDVGEAAAVIAAGETHDIDVGFVGDRAFFESTSIGLHAALFREGARFDKGDRLALVRAIAVIVRYRTAGMRIELSDRTITTHALAVSVANGPYAGLAFTVAPGARLDDGNLDVRVFRGFSKWQLVRHFASIVAGRRAIEPRIETYRSPTVRITAARPLPVRPDDEPPLATPVSFRVEPRSLRVIVPRTTRPDHAVLETRHRQEERPDEDDEHTDHQDDDHRLLPDHGDADGSADDPDHRDDANTELAHR
jgi:diacylglycerol kinase (ATP)